MRNKIFLAVITAMFMNQPLLAANSHEHTAAPQLTILEPKNGATVGTTFTVKFGASGVSIVPAGADHGEHHHDAHHHHHNVQSGHVHLLTDVDTLPSPDRPMPANANITHLTQGQTEAQLTLSPGKHTLQLVLGNSSHMTGATPVVSKKITVIVK